MGEKTSNDAADALTFAQRLKRVALWVFFALILLIPRLLGLRRRVRLWNAARLALALLGAVLITAVRGDPTARLSPLLGLLLLLLALLLRPTREGKSVDERARELGALLVVNGGQLLLADGARVPVTLFVGPEQVQALDRKLDPRLEIPYASVVSLRMEPGGEKDAWRLVIEFREGQAAFVYQRTFAEHLARVAETALRSQLRHSLPVMKSGESP